MAQLELRLESGDEQSSRRVELPAATRDEVVALMLTAMVAVLKGEKGGDDEEPRQSQDRS